MLCMKDFFNKYKIVISVTIIGIILLIITKSCSIVIENNIRQDIKNDEKPTSEYLIKYKDDWINLIAFLLQGKIDFKDFPLSKNFLNKYNVANDILRGKVMGTHDAIAQTFDITEDIEKHIMTIGVKTGRGLEEVAYQLHYVINEKNELDDIEILDSKVIEDENGEFIQYEKFTTYSESSKGAIFYLTNPVRYWDMPCYLTENYKNNHNNYKKDSIIPWKEWLYVDEANVICDDKNDKIWYIYALNTKETRKYKLIFAVDDKDYVDEVIVEELEIKVTENSDEVQEEYDLFYS